MQGSKEQFLALRELENLTYDYTVTKRDVISNGKKAAQELIERAERDPFEILANVSRLKEFINSVESELKKADVFEVIDKAESRYGIEFSTRSTGDRLDYEADETYAELTQKLKDRAELLKTAWKSKDTIYDSEGIEVPKVGIKTHGKNTLVMKF